MKAEKRKELERNELAARLNTAWQGLTSNSTTVTVIWSVILIGLVALIGYRYYARSSAETRSELWSRLDRSAEVSELEKMAKDHANTEAGRIAKFHLSRFQLQDALTRLASTTNDEKLKAAEEIEKARDRYAELAKESTREPLLAQEAMMEVAKAEEVLAGVPTEKDLNVMRGSLDKALEGYDALAKKYPQSVLGEKAALVAITVGRLFCIGPKLGVNAFFGPLPECFIGDSGEVKDQFPLLRARKISKQETLFRLGTGKPLLLGLSHHICDFFFDL